MIVSNFPKSGGKDGGCGEDSDFTNNRKQRTRQVGQIQMQMQIQIQQRTRQVCLFWSTAVHCCQNDRNFEFSDFWRKTNWILFWISRWFLLDFQVIFFSWFLLNLFGILCEVVGFFTIPRLNVLSNHRIVAWVARRPERPLDFQSIKVQRYSVRLK